MALFEDLISRSLKGLEEVNEVLRDVVRLCAGLSAEGRALAHGRL